MGSKGERGISGNATTAGAFFDLGKVQASASLRHTLLRFLVTNARLDLADLLDKAPTLSGSRAWSLWKQLAPLEWEDYRHATGRYDAIVKEFRAARKALQGRPSEKSKAAMRKYREELRDYNAKYRDLKQSSIQEFRTTFDVIRKALRRPDWGSDHWISASYLKKLEKEEVPIPIYNPPHAPPEVLEQNPEPLMELGPELERFVEIFRRERHTPTPEGFRAYVEDVCPAILGAMDRLEVGNLGQFQETDCRLHTHILGGRGCGKSELLKLLIHHYVRHPELGAVVLIDPHNDLAHDISRWREFADDPERLVYIDAGHEDYFPALNPLVVDGLSPGELEQFALLMADAIEGFSSSQTLTDNMRTLARACLRVVLEGKNPTLDDLRRMLGSPNNPKAAELLGRAKRHPRLGEFFRYEFDSQNLVPSKGGLVNRLENVLLLHRLGHSLTAPNPIDLEGLINAGKVILVGLGSSGADELGRILLARITMIGMKRKPLSWAENTGRQHTPVNVFVDEAQRMIGPTILRFLNELRKRGMRLTLAHQSLGQVNPEFRDALWSGAGIKIFGATDDGESLRRMFGQAPPHIPQFQFALRWGMLPADEVVFLTEPHGHLRDRRNDMNPDQYRKLMEFQLATYYQTFSDQTPDTAPDPEDESPLKGLRPLE